MTLPLNEQANDALRVVGGYRRWHLSMYLALATSLSLALCWQNIAFVFTGWEPDHHCKVPHGYQINQSIPMETGDDGAQRFSRCYEFVNRSLGNETQSCSNGWTYDTDGEITIVTEWDLVCSKTFFSELTQVLYPVGCTVGELIATYLMDKIGRKWIHISGHIGVALIGCGMALTQTYVTFLILRAIIGGFVMSTLHSGLALIMEMWDADRRSTVGVALQLMWSVVYTALAALVYFIRNWRHLQATISVFSIVWIVYIWLLPESVMWLVANRKVKEAEQILNKMAKWNGVKDKTISLQNPDDNLPQTEEVESEKPKEIFQDKKDNDMASPRIRDLFLDGKLRIHYVIGSLLLFANTLVYYGLILSTPALAGSRYLNFLLGGLVEIPGYIVSIFVVRRFGRRLPLCVFHIVAGVPLAIIAFLPQKTELEALQMTAALIGKFGITITFAVAVMYLREIFPTNLRGISIGLCNLLATAGMMLAPYAAYLAKRTPWVPNVMFAVVSITVGVLVLILPETRDLPLPQTVSDIHVMWKTRGLEKRKAVLLEKANVSL